MKFPILGILGLIFITLKLTGHIAWSWLWVLSPFWIPVSIVAVLTLITLVIKYVKFGSNSGNKGNRFNG